MGALPNATAVVHPRGAPHMIDPAKLIAGTRAVYGDELYAQLYGEILPIARERIVIAQDGQRFELAGPHVRVRAHARARAASPGHRRSRRGQHLHRRYLRRCPIASSTRRRALDHADHHAHAVRSRSAQGLHRPAHAVPAASDISHSLQRSGAMRAAGQRHDEAIDDYVRIARARGLDDGAHALRAARLAHPACAITAANWTSTPSIQFLNKDFELNAAGLAAWLKREAN